MLRGDGVHDGQTQAYARTALTTPKAFKQMQLLGLTHADSIIFKLQKNLRTAAATAYPDLPRLSVHQGVVQQIAQQILQIIHPPLHRRRGQLKLQAHALTARRLKEIIGPLLRELAQIQPLQGLLQRLDLHWRGPG